MNIQEQIEIIRLKIKELNSQIEWLEGHEEVLNKTGLNGYFFAGSLDFDHLSHPQVITLIKAIGGKWEKTPSTSSAEPRIDYSTKFEGITIRCYQGEPPPSCKIVEVEEDVPAVPAGKKIVRKLVCVEAQETATEPAIQTATPESNEVIA